MNMLNTDVACEYHVNDGACYAFQSTWSKNHKRFSSFFIIREKSGRRVVQLRIRKGMTLSRACPLYILICGVDWDVVGLVGSAVGS